MTPKRPPEEPSAAMRGVARTLRDMYAALVGEGFTENQALAMVGDTLSVMLTASINREKGDDDATD